MGFLNNLIWVYVIVIIVGFILAYLYRSIAIRLNIVDKPNHRSLHVTPTIRGGGIIFPLLLIPGLFITGTFVSNLLAASLILITAISFWDDLDPRTPLQRFIIHLVVALAWVYYLFPEIPVWSILVLIVLFIGFLNAYNFMDGINGITVLYTAAIWGLLRIFETNWLLAEWGSFTVVGMDVAIIVFAFFNVRKKAIFFAGDVGAISVACFIAVNLCLLIVRDHSFYWLGLVALYGVDTGLTIFRRLLQKEQIWEAHKKHIFQQMVYFYGGSHLQVSISYALLQFFLGGCLIMIANYFNIMVSGICFIISLAILAIIYIVLVKRANNGRFIEKQKVTAISR